MSKSRPFTGLCMLCALLVSAVAAQGASAATNGTTGTAGGSAYTGGITTSGGETLFHGFRSGVEVEIKSTELTGSGAQESMLAGTGEHTSNGTGIIEYKNTTVVKPSGKKCVVKTGEIKTTILKATTAGQGMGLLVEPNAGTLFAEFEVEGCTIGVINGVYKVTGSVVGEPSGTEIVFTRAGTTSQGTLKLGGMNAGIAGVVKLKTSGGTAIEAQTVETP